MGDVKKIEAEEKVRGLRQAIAARLEMLAIALRAGEPIQVGGLQVTAPEELALEVELEQKGDTFELEVEIQGEGKAAAYPLVAILTGSPSDLKTVVKARQALEEMGVPCEVRVLSAHRTPDMTLDYIRSAQKRGVEVFIACAGLAAHLAGTVAANSMLPVIGVPLAAGPLSGLDSLLSTVQMPPGVPVATVSVDGARNAAFLAARILALKYPRIRKGLQRAIAAQRARYEAALADAAPAGEPEAGGEAGA